MAERNYLEAANEFFWTDEFMETFEKFAAEKCAPFKGVQAEGEQPLECMAVYKEFQALYEGKLEEFLSSQGIDAYEFAVQCKQALQQGDTSSDKAFVTILLSMAEYEYFVRMMCEMAEGVA